MKNGRCQVGDDPFYLKFWAKLTTFKKKTQIFNWYSLVAGSAITHTFTIRQSPMYMCSLQYSCMHRHSHDFVWGVHFFLPKKVDDLFFSRRSQRMSKYTSKSNPPSKNCPKNWLLLWLGVHFVSRGCTYTFSRKLHLKKIFSPLWGVQVHPLHPLAMLMLVWQTNECAEIMCNTNC